MLYLLALFLYQAPLLARPALLSDPSSLTESLEQAIIYYRSFSRDVIAFKNPKVKRQQSFYPHQAQETVKFISVYSFTAQ